MNEVVCMLVCMVSVLDLSHMYTFLKNYTVRNISHLYFKELCPQYCKTHFIVQPGIKFKTTSAFLTAHAGWLSGTQWKVS